MRTDCQQRPDGAPPVASSALLGRCNEMQSDYFRKQRNRCDRCGALLFGKKYADIPFLCKQCRRGTRNANT